MTKVLIEDMPDELWDRYKNLVPRSINLQNSVIERVKEFVEKKEAEQKWQQKKNYLKKLKVKPL